MAEGQAAVNVRQLQLIDPGQAPTRSSVYKTKAIGTVERRQGYMETLVLLCN